MTHVQVDPEAVVRGAGNVGADGGYVSARIGGVVILPGEDSVSTGKTGGPPAQAAAIDAHSAAATPWRRS